MGEDPQHLRATRWASGRQPEPISLEEAAELLRGWSQARPVICIDVDAAQPAEELTRELQAVVGPALTHDMVADLIEQDRLPGAASYPGGVRKVSMFGASAYDDGGQDGTTAGRLVFDFVEVLAGPGWLLSCCQAPMVLPARSTAPLERDRRFATRSERFLEAVARRWEEHEFRTPGDLGVLILHELTCTYRDARAHLYRWLDEWEEGFFRNDRDERDTLIELRTMLSEFRKRLAAKNVPDDEADRAWFSDVSHPVLAQRADQQIDRAITDLLSLTETLRATFDLVQMQLSQKQQESSERLGRKVELITSVLLVPTLVAGFYGANTRLPGEPGQGPWTGFEVMLATMVLGSIAVFFGLRYLRRRYEPAT